MLHGNAMKKEASNKVVWSRFTSVGETTLLEALRVLNPSKSPELPTNEKSLLTYIEQLRDEGHKPTVLTSKDVYRYTSCTSVPRPAAKQNFPNLDVAYSKKTKAGRARRRRRTLEKKTEVNYALLSPAAKVVLKNQPTIILTNMSEEILKDSKVLSRPPAFNIASPTHMSTCITLTNISGPSRGPTARLQFHTGVWPSEVAMANSRHATSAHNGHADTLWKVNSGFSNGIHHNGVHVLQNGRVLKESNGVPYWRNPKRRREEDDAEDKLSLKKRSNGVWVVSRHEDARFTQQNNFPSIKIDRSITDEEVRRKAQKILQVNLCPVVEIRPLMLAYAM